jgi:hypothetical protein
VAWPEERLITLEGYEVTAQKITERYLFWVVRGVSDPDSVYAVYLAKGLEGLKTDPTGASVYLAATGKHLVWYNPMNKQIWGVPLNEMSANPVELSMGAPPIANRPFSASAHYIAAVSEGGKIYLISTDRGTAPALLGEGAHVSLPK